MGLLILNRCSRFRIHDQPSTVTSNEDPDPFFSGLGRCNTISWYLFFIPAIKCLTSSGAAKECNTADGGESLSLTSPEQLDALKGCTILNGHIEIQSGYQGDVVLDGVTEVHGNISTVEDGAGGLGLFELYDLVAIDAIHLQGISGDVHLPNLERIGDLELIQRKDKGEADLGSLVEAENVLILGSWTRYAASTHTFNISDMATVQTSSR